MSSNRTLGLTAALLTALLLCASTLTTPASAAPSQPPAAPLAAKKQAGQKKQKRVVSRRVAFDVVNHNDTSVLCRGDGRTYPVRGRLVGPRNVVDGGAGARRFNVLVHDAGTGGWFWNLRRHPRYDYATQLARQGETSLVLDRLGYDASPLRDGRATCLGAQATMLHQVVQRLYSGRYAYAGRAQVAPHAGRIVVHGHGTGGAIAQVEAAEFHDTAGLVLMSWSGAVDASAAAVDEARRQSLACLRGADAAAYGASAADFRRLLFARAAIRVQRTAAGRRNPTPCGDVASLAPTALTALGTARQVRVPVLVLAGNKDRRLRGDARDAAAPFTGSRSVTARTIPGTGSALPLEKSAPRTRRIVQRWLHAR